MVQLHNFFFNYFLFNYSNIFFSSIIFNRDVPIGAPFSNGTLSPIPILSFPLLVYLHSRKFIRSTDKVKSRVLVRARRLILLPVIIGISLSGTRARKAPFRFVSFPFFISLFSNPRGTYHI